MKFVLLIAGLVLSFHSTASLRVASYNIRNFDYDERSHVSTNKEYLYTTLTEVNADLLAVQEINQTETFKRFVESKFQKRYGVSLTECGGAHGQKLGFVYDKRKLSLVSFEQDLRTSNPGQRNNLPCNDGSRPLAIAKFKMLDTNQDLIAISVHLKSGGAPKSVAKRFQQISIIASVVADYKKMGYSNFIIMGDFNSTEYIFKGEHYNKFKFAVEKMGLNDLASEVECTAYWWGGIDDGKQYPSILDHMLVSPGLITDKKTTRAKPLAHCQKVSCEATWDSSLGMSFEEVSDHCPMVSDL
jgi:endonuclease/exonuclease/phosphatase family metal-dependent hydrolase